MTRLVIPTDFSEPAQAALKFGTSLARELKSRVELVHVIDKISGATLIKSIDVPVTQTAEQELKKIAAEMGNVLGKTKIHYRIIKGHIAEGIVQTAEGIDADLIVMGTRGVSRLTEFLLGSITLAVLRKIHRPVLVVPPDSIYETPSNIVLAIDSKGYGKNVFRLLVVLSKAFRSHIWVFHVAEDEQDLKYPFELDRYLSSCEYSYHSLISRNVHQSIEGFVSEKGSNLLCLVRRKKSATDRIFHGSTTRKELFSTELPLLILRE